MGVCIVIVTIATAKDIAYTTLYILHIGRSVDHIRTLCVFGFV